MTKIRIEFQDENSTEFKVDAPGVSYYTDGIKRWFMQAMVKRNAVSVKSPEWQLAGEISGESVYRLIGSSIVSAGNLS